MNERITEQMTRDALRRNFYYDRKHFNIEEQMSSSLKISTLLRGASKSGKGIGRPEFIITSTFVQNLLIVIECKADIRKQISKTMTEANDYAVDGALHYAKFLSRGFNVIAIGISGQTEKEIKIDTYFWLKGDKGFVNLSVNEILPIEKYIAIIEENKGIHKRRKQLLMDKKEKEKESKAYSILFIASCIAVPPISYFIGRFIQPFGEKANKFMEWFGITGAGFFLSLYLYNYFT